ncbi:hypothetical protein WA026_001030 [Henosepilachna vigintioctopunctata]|uniref:Uncharacterized protein n=1 Tax=Henosepilachna vigintioctopunctata TaxID=420089 RepID=A0AAW1UZJ8_9CUCU
MGYCKLLFVFVLLSNGYQVINGDITINGVNCGVKKCKIGEYCSSFNNICEPCDSVCTSSHHNFDEVECTKNCQDYLHEIKYAKHDESSGISDKGLEKLKDEVKNLSRMVTVTLALVCVMFLILALVLGFQFYRWKLKKNITLQDLKTIFFKKSDATGDVRMEDSANRNNGNVKPDLRLDISTISTVSEHSPVTAITSISTRRPAEDCALDYVYDNHAMSSSPK